MKNKQRQLKMQVKDLSETGTFEGILSPYGNVDDGGDCVDAGAYAKTIAEHGNKIPVLWSHKTDCPIGELTLEDRPDGLYCTGQLLMDDSVPEARKAYALLKARIVRGLSIGYDAIKSQVVDGVRHLKELRLFEGSLVVFPMNEQALVSAVKGRSGIKGDFVEELTEVQLQDAGYQMRSALSCALSSVLWSSMSREEMLSATQTILTQFSDAYLAYLPDYLDMLAEMYGGDTKQWSSKRETKEGRRLSAATKDQMAACHEHMKSATDIMVALMAEEAGDSDESATSKASAVVEHKSEPDDFHSVAQILTSMRSLLTQ